MRRMTSKSSSRAMERCFSGLTLDRAEQQRKNRAWVEEQRRSESARLILFSDESVLIRKEPQLISGLEGLSVPLANISGSEALLSELVLLGTMPPAVFASSIKSDDQAKLRDELQHASGTVLEWTPVRKCLPAIGDSAALVGLGKSMTKWHESARFCGRCGSPTTTTDGGASRKCQSESCGEVTYPRINPCAIMLVLDGQGKCLLGKIKGRPFYSTLAGFCSHGESVEETVRREVMEEAGVEVTDVMFHSSQSWPFPYQLMMGFHAFASDAAKREIHYDPVELEDAKWFDRDETKRMMSGQHPEGLVVPPSYSIAHQLIRAWIEGEVDDFGRPQHPARL